MNSDDVTAGLAVMLGAVLSIALTVGLLDSGPLRTASLESARFSRPAPFVGFAIIDGSVETMVGPEGPYSGWSPSATPLFQPR